MHTALPFEYFSKKKKKSEHERIVFKARIFQHISLIWIKLSIFILKVVKISHEKMHYKLQCMREIYDSIFRNMED